MLDEVDRYDPLTDAWETLAPLAKPRARHAIVEAGGELIVAGGVAVIDLMTLIDTPEPSIEVGPLDGSDFGPAFAMQRPRGAVRVSPFDGGVRLLITGTGDNGGPPDQTGEMALH